MKKLIREYFFLRKGERRGLIVLLVFFLILNIVRSWMLYHSSTEVTIDPYFESEMRLLKAKYEASLPELVPVSKPHRKSSILFPFDPNTLSFDSLKLLPFPTYVPANIVKYREAGGAFQEGEDLLKIYGMNEESYEKIRSYVVVEEDDKERVEEEMEREGVLAADRINDGRRLASEEMKRKERVIDVNKCDSLDLQEVRGIGKVFSKRIVKYRDLLGGFYSEDQYWEIYGVDSLKYELMKQYLRIEASEIKRIDINECGYKELLRHPYIDRQMVEAILAYRDFIGSYESVEKLLIDGVVDSLKFEKIRRYLLSGKE